MLLREKGREEKRKERSVLAIDKSDSRKLLHSLSFP